MTVCASGTEAALFLSDGVIVLLVLYVILIGLAGMSPFKHVRACDKIVSKKECKPKKICT